MEKFRPPFQRRRGPRGRALWSQLTVGQFEQKREIPFRSETEQEVRNGESKPSLREGYEEGRTRPPLLVAIHGKVNLQNVTV